MEKHADNTDFPLSPWEGPAIMLLDLDAFFASVEQLDHPAWRGKPVIVGGDAEKHGVVSTCSYEARAYGVRSAMAASLAKQLCPDAIWTHGHYARYKEISNLIMGIIRDETPHVQQVSIDEAFADISPTKVNTEHPAIVARRIQARVEKLGVTCSIGLGTSKSVAKIASDLDKPHGLTIVYPGSEKAFLNPLPIRKMSGIGPSAEKTLVNHGIRTLGDLANADESLLNRVFGKNAAMMRERASGQDHSPVAQDDTVKSISNEITFANDLTNQEDIEAALLTISSKVGRRLRKKQLAGRTLTVKVRFDDRSSKTAQCQLSSRTNDELVFGPSAVSLALKLWRPGLKIRLLGIGVSGFEESEFVQNALFELPDASATSEDKEISGEQTSREYDFANGPRKRTAPSPQHNIGSKLNKSQRERLIAATDSLKDRFGENSVRFGLELRNEGNTTGSGSKNPADYK